MAKKSVKAVSEAMLDVPKYKPTINLDKSLYPDIENLKIDQVVNLTIKAKITNISRDRWNKNRLSVTAEIQNADGHDENDSADDDAYEDD